MTLELLVSHSQLQGAGREYRPTSAEIRLSQEASRYRDLIVMCFV